MGLDKWCNVIDHVNVAFYLPNRIDRELPALCVLRFSIKINLFDIPVSRNIL